MLKKIISVFILTCLVFTGATGCKSIVPNAFESQSTSMPNMIAKNPEDIMLFSFEDGKGDGTLYQGSLQSLDITDAPWNQSFVEPISISHHTDTGNGFKMPLNNSSDVWYQILRSSTPEEYKANVENHKYLRLWVSNVGDGPLALSVLISAGMYYFSFLNAEKAIVTEKNGTLLNVQKTFTVDKFIPEADEFGYDSVVLPAGFSGWIAFPLIEETINYWNSSPVTNLSSATTIDFRLLSESQKTNYYVIDDVCLTNNKIGTIRSD